MWLFPTLVFTLITVQSFALPAPIDGQRCTRDDLDVIQTAQAAFKRHSHEEAIFQLTQLTQVCRNDRGVGFLLASIYGDRCGALNSPVLEVLSDFNFGEAALVMTTLVKAKLPKLKEEDCNRAERIIEKSVAGTTGELHDEQILIASLKLHRAAILLSEAVDPEGSGLPRMGIDFCSQADITDSVITKTLAGFNDGMKRIVTSGKLSHRRLLERYGFLCGHPVVDGLCALTKDDRIGPYLLMFRSVLKGGSGIGFNTFGGDIFSSQACMCF